MKTPAIVLRRYYQGESDLILSLMTREYGKLRAIAKGALRSQKRFMGQLMLYQHLELSLVKPKFSQLMRLQGSTLLDSFTNLSSDIRNVAQASVLAEIVEIAVGEAQSQPKVFDLLLAGLSDIDQDKPLERTRLVYQIKLLDALGYRPALADCALCNCDLPAGKLIFSMDLGGAVCSACTRGAARKTDILPDTRMTLLKALELDRDKLDRLQFTKRTVREARSLLDEFTIFHLERNLNSIQFIRDLER